MNDLRIVLMISLIIYSTMSHATRPRQFPFLNFAAFVYFHNHDLPLMLSALDKALNCAPDGSKVFWRNPATCASGYSEVSNTSYRSGPECRDVHIFNKTAYAVDINFF